jgi:hypothetical protein
LCRVLLIEFVGPRSNDPVVRTDGAKLLVERGQLLLLRPVRDGVQILDYLSLGGRYDVTQWLEAAGIADERSLRQQACEQIRFRFSLQKPAEILKPCLDRGGAFLPRVHHQVEICVVDCGCEADQERFVGRANRRGQIRPLA